MPSSSAAFKLPPGTIRQIKGERYILKNSRWQRLEPADRLEHRRSQAEDIQAAADRTELAADLEKERPYTAKVVSNSVQIIVAPKSLDLGDFSLERSQVEINLVGKELSIGTAINTIRYKDGRPPSVSESPGINFTPANYSVLRPDAKQIDIHEYLYGSSTYPGILKKSIDGKYAQFTNPEQMPFREAIDYFANKTNLDTDSWVEGQGIVQQAAFTVAGAKGVLLQDIRDAVALAVDNGVSIANFAKEFDRIADRYSANWELKGDRAWRAQLIYEQNLRQANAAGRYAQMTDPETIKRRPYWQWVHGDSRNPRPVHLALDGKVFPADSLPFHPPSGFGCRCVVHSLSQRDIDRENLTIENLVPGQDIDYTDPKTGQTRPIKLEPDKGFNWKPEKDITADRRAEILKNLEPDLRAAVERETLWRPLMTQAEASEYTKDSYYADQDFYHGTSAEAAQGIITKGAKLVSDVVNTYGDGFYLAFDKDIAFDYAQQAAKPTVLTTKVLTQNPKKFRDSIEVEDFLSDNNIPADDLQSQAMTRLLKKQGFDAIEIGGNQVLVIIFSKQQLAIFNSEEV